MSKELKSKIYEIIDSIEDEGILQMVMEDIVNYANNSKVAEELTKEQLKELDEAITEADKNETIDWDVFKKEINEWKKR